MMKAKRMNIKTLVFVAMMGAVSTVLMLLDFPLPIAPSFLKFDISELPALFAGFFLGPISGCGVILIKILLKLLTQGTDTVFVGELSNLIGSMCFVLSASLIYKFKHTKKGAILSLSIATLVVSIAYVLINAFIALPLYVNLYGMSMDAIVGMGTAVNPMVKDVITLLLLSIFPFNILKYGVTSLLTYLIYKKAGNALKKALKI